MRETKILIADDEELVRRFLVQVLAGEGYTVISASDGAEAVRMAEEHRIDLALLDISMPEMNGIEACRRMKEMDPSIQILMMTGRPEFDPLMEAFAANGIVDYLLKPLEISLLRTAVQEAIDKRNRLLSGPLTSNKKTNRIGELEREYKKRTFDLRESQLKYRNIVEHSKDMIIVAQDERIQYANPRAVELSGYSREELFSIPLIKTIHPEDQHIIRKAYQKRLWEQPSQPLIPFRIVRKDQTSLWVEMNVMGTVWEGKPALLTLLRDISGRIQTEDALQIKNYAIASSPNPIAFADLKENLTYVNQSFLNLLGHREETEVLGRPLREVLKQNSNLELPLHEVIRSPEHTGSREMVITRKDGSCCHVHATVSSVADSSKKPICLMVSLVDVTHQKNMTDLMFRAEKLSALGQFAAGLAHELKNPLGVISSCAQFCLEHLALDKLLKENLQVMYRNSQRANRLIEGLLGFARPPRLVRKQVDIHEILEKAIQMVRLEARSYEIHFSLDFDRGLPNIWVDEDKLGQVFLNILLNAIQALGGKGQVVTRTRLNASQDRLQVDITDNGPGIAAEYRHRIFDPFFTTKDGGTGLGLSICHSIVMEHGGGIQVEFPPGGGTRISVSLPYTQPPPGATVGE